MGKDKQRRGHHKKYGASIPGQRHASSGHSLSFTDDASPRIDLQLHKPGIIEALSGKGERKHSDDSVTAEELDAIKVWVGVIILQHTDEIAFRLGKPMDGISPERVVRALKNSVHLYDSWGKKYGMAERYVDWPLNEAELKDWENAVPHLDDVNHHLYGALISAQCGFYDLTEKEFEALQRAKFAREDLTPDAARIYEAMPSALAKLSYDKFIAIAHDVVQGWVQPSRPYAPYTMLDGERQPVARAEGPGLDRSELDVWNDLTAGKNVQGKPSLMDGEVFRLATMPIGELRELVLGAMRGQKQMEVDVARRLDGVFQQRVANLIAEPDAGSDKIYDTLRLIADICHDESVQMLSKAPVSEQYLAHWHALRDTLAWAHQSRELRELRASQQIRPSTSVQVEAIARDPELLAVTPDNAYARRR